MKLQFGSKTQSKGFFDDVIIKDIDYSEKLNKIGERYTTQDVKVPEPNDIMWLENEHTEIPVKIKDVNLDSLIMYAVPIEDYDKASYGNKHIKLSIDDIGNTLFFNR